MIFRQNNLKILSMLGEGLNANVYMVSKSQRNINLRKVFALKVLKRSEDIGHFKTEFESLLKADGKHIVKYRGWESYKSKPALLLEYINGVTLHQLLQNINLTTPEARWIHQETTAGLRELSSSGLFHGDLSPKNIMIDANGDIKLIDFGLTHWRTQNIELTPEFAAPSVLKGEKPSLASDMQSLSKIYSQYNLKPSDTKTLSKPPSLSLKVCDLQSMCMSTTKSLEFPSRFAPKLRIKLGQLKKLVFIFATYLFISPVTAQNYTLLTHEILLRSPNWLAVRKSDQDPWCYTPCNLTFQKTGMHELSWKNQLKSGQLSLYVDKTIKSLNLRHISK